MQPSQMSHLADAATLEGHLSFHSENFTPVSSFHHIPSALTPTNTAMAFHREGTFTKNYAPSSESIQTSLASKLNNFYLQTPAMSATPAFDQSPTFGQGPIMHMNSTLSMTTPNVGQERFNSSPEFIAGGGPFPQDAVGGYSQGLQLKFADPPAMGHARLEHSPMGHARLEHSPMGHGRMDRSPMRPNFDVSHRNLFSQTISTHDQMSNMIMSKIEDNNTVTQGSSQSMEFFAPFKNEPLSDEMGSTLEEFLRTDPFSEISVSADPVDTIVEADEQDGQVDVNGEEISRYLHFDNIASSPTPGYYTSCSLDQSPRKQRSSRSSPSKQKVRTSTMAPLHMPQSLKLLRKLKSFTTGTKHSALAGPSFSLEECLNEFHVAEGNYAFQDETARVSMQLGPAFHSPTIKRKSSSKFPKALAKPVLRKVKTTNNLCLQNAFRSSPKVLKNMESGLMSFQVKLNNSNPE